MECKDVELALNEVQNAVLIETLWNVKSQILNKIRYVILY